MKHTINTYIKNGAPIDSIKLERIYSAFDEKKVTITVSDQKRSKGQNDFFHPLVRELGSHLGYMQDEMKEIVKFKFLLTETMINGEVIQFIKPTSSLDVREMRDLIERLIIWSADQFNVILANPYTNQ